MALVVNTNISSLIAQNNVTKANNAFSTSVERLSSGLRINKASDDVAGLSISEKLKAQTRSIYQAVRNGNEAINLLQVTDGALREIGNILGRMRELGESASNGTLGATERNALDSEYQELKSEIDRISVVTEYNGQKLIDGTISASSLSFQVGFQNTSNDRISITVNSAGASALQLSETNAISITAATEAQSSLTNIDSAIQIVASLRGDVGAKQSRLNTAISNLGTTAVNYEAAVSSITDADFAVETAAFTKNQIIAQAAISVLAQANVLPQQALSLLG